MWTYYQKSGELWVDVDKIATGYSGYETGKNNPFMEDVRDVGPIPCGEWILIEPYNSKRVGPFAIKLEPVGHNAHGRTAFRIHGDSRRNPGKASHGCIIFPRKIREQIWASKDHRLIVLP